MFRALALQGLGFKALCGSECVGVATCAGSPAFIRSMHLRKNWQYWPF